MGGDDLVDYEAVYGDIVNLKMMCRLNLSKVLTWVRCVCAFIEMGTCVYV